MLENFNTGIENFKIRKANREDSEIILKLIKALAKFEKLEDEVVATKESIEISLFDKKQAEVIIGEEKGEPVAFALFFHNYSTFLGKAGLYLEDLYVKEEFRQKGYGKIMFEALKVIAKSRGCERLDWWCLDWNKKAVEFYKSMGATAMDEWTVYRLTKESL